MVTTSSSVGKRRRAGAGRPDEAVEDVEDVEAAEGDDAVETTGDVADDAAAGEAAAPDETEHAPDLRWSGWAQLAPPWVLVPQLFLAGGWLRAATSHALSDGWWSGQEVLDFSAAHAETAIVGYDAFLAEVVGPLAAPVAIGVLVAQFIVGFLLIVNWRPLVALGLGAFLNLNFMLAGAVNPSIFYLVSGAGIALWHIHHRLSPDARGRLAKITLRLALVAVVLLAPAVTTLDPNTVKEDPAPTLIFFVLLAVFGTKSLEHRRSTSSAS